MVNKAMADGLDPDDSAAFGRLLSFNLRNASVTVCELLTGKVVSVARLQSASFVCRPIDMLMQGGPGRGRTGRDRPWMKWAPDGQSLFLGDAPAAPGSLSAPVKQLVF